MFFFYLLCSIRYKKLVNSLLSCIHLMNYYYTYIFIIIQAEDIFLWILIFVYEENSNMQPNSDKIETTIQNFITHY